MAEDQVWINSTYGLSNMTYTEADVPRLNQDYEGASLSTFLAHFAMKYSSSLALASSLGSEDQVLTHALREHPEVRLVVLDTGRLHEETYALMSEMEKRYSLTYDVYLPEAASVEAMVKEKGVNLFYESVENRKQCCHLRKVAPLQRALSDKKAWITGQRRAQSVTRASLPLIEWDHTHNILKLNPLAAWSQKEVWEYLNSHQVPYNALHDQGFPSIGCAPCTRAIKEGEDVRAGRWWWESPENKECGLHIESIKKERK